jgi:DNA-directed RNA polymerase specialized sigma24 family protein
MSYSPFPPTRWTVVLSAKVGVDDHAAEALEQLAIAYWQPIYSYLRGKGNDHIEAQDATQGFFAYLLSRDFLRNIEPEGGRFRNFLLVALRRWMKDERNRAINVKRREELEWQPWYEMEAVPLLAETSPEKAFDRTWAEALVAHAMSAVEARWSHRAELFAALRLTVECPEDAEKYAVIARRTGMSEGAVGKAAHDLRQQFAEEIRCQVRETVAQDADVEEELRYLIRLLQS